MAVCKSMSLEPGDRRTLFTYVYICIYICTYVHVYICTYVHTHRYTHTHMRSLMAVCKSMPPKSGDRRTLFKALGFRRTLFKGLGFRV